MAMHVLFNEREITNPVAKFFMVFFALAVAGLITAGVVFVLLPLLGVTVVVTVSFVLAIVAAAIVGAFVLIIVAFIYSLIKGSLHVRVEKHRH